MSREPRPLPKFLVQRYKGWQATDFAENANWYARLASEGQRPRAMMIACCDSRVHVSSIFGADRGEFFIHRNIANLVPPYKPDGDLHGTSAAIEYAVTALEVSNLLVMGHSRCGGVVGCLDMCEGAAPALERQTSFVGRWMELLRAGHAKIAHIPDREARLTALEHQAVLTSLENLRNFPFVAERLDAGTLSLHGLWHDIGTGVLFWYDPCEAAFRKV